MTVFEVENALEESLLRGERPDNLDELELTLGDLYCEWGETDDYRNSEEGERDGSAEGLAFLRCSELIDHFRLHT